MGEFVIFRKKCTGYYTAIDASHSAWYVQQHGHSREFYLYYDQLSQDKFV